MFPSAVVARVASLKSSALRLGDGDDPVYGRTGYHLLHPRRPLDDHAIHPLVGAESEVQAAVVLAGESRSAVDDAALAQIACLDRHLGADRAAIAAGAYQLESDPVVGAVRKIAVDESGLVLVGDDDVHRAAIPQVGERHRSSVVKVGRTDLLRDVDP